MAGLRDGARHGVSCGTGRPNVKVPHVKLTETAQRALESCPGGKDRTSSQPSVCFQGSQGHVKIPKVDSSNEVKTFSFSSSNVGKDNPQGSLDCVQQMNSSSGDSKLTSLGVIQNKITVRATSDSCQTTKARLTQVEEESCNRNLKVIKAGGPFLGRRVPIKKLIRCGSSPVLVRNKVTSTNCGKTSRRSQKHSSVSHRPYKDRVVHLLALKNYKKPELLARLQRDGVNQKDRNSLGIILKQVASLNPKDNCYVLRDYLFKDIQKDWPGYTEEERQSLELILSKKLNPPQSAATATTTSSDSVSAATSKNNDKSTTQKRHSSPISVRHMGKKQRIAHQSNRMYPLLSSHLPALSAKATTAPLLSTTTTTTILTPSSALLPSTCLISSTPQVALYKSPSTPKGQGSQKLPVATFSQNGSIACEVQQEKHTSLTPCGTPVAPAVQVKPPVSAGKKPVVLHKKSCNVKEHEKNKSNTQDVRASEEKKNASEEETSNWKKSSDLDSGDGLKETCTASVESPSSTSEQPDYILKYTAIGSYNQRQSYEDDFNAEFDEYRTLHARIDSVIKRFTQLDELRKSLSPGSKEYEVFCEEVLEEYQKVKESYPSYYEEKHRCEYLHKKLSHIKRMVVEFDRQQAETWHYALFGQHS
ncbi:RNA polymerase II elongation factor ELL2 [Falco cherrug]|uniref:RNA polymerase II elongation factor ELL2 n=1 Tax=Falco cherrug TaxID=345164 RepID=UPI0024790CFB|nr:RNA polymerase II elongation factor ELL2 [Falco cherrug]